MKSYGKFPKQEKKNLSLLKDMFELDDYLYEEKKRKEREKERMNWNNGKPKKNQYRK